jgi:hypothetical protein
MLVSTKESTEEALTHEHTGSQPSSTGQQHRPANMNVSSPAACQTPSDMQQTVRVCAPAAHLYAPLVLPPLPDEARGLKMPTIATRSPGLQESTRSDSSTISTAAAHAAV